MTHVKICCISSIEEANIAVKYGASAIGLVSEMPSGPGVISEKTIKKIAEQTSPSISTFLLTSKQNVDEIIEQHHRCGTNTIQLCDKIITGSHFQLKKALPRIKIVQVIHVTDDESINEAIETSNFVDAILLDSGNQKLVTKELGGTGRTHDWSISRKIVESVKIPVYLAGGLNSQNVVEAILQVKPYGVDICSGVRTNSRLDEEKLKLFFDRVKSVNKLLAVDK
ncbi:MAG: phosphoribosylanthranilate isomerase [Ignavibacteriales bacterium]|nr:phosphoribosylanthranilate isomerase [Ignavibacteriales bacterium]